MKKQILNFIPRELEEKSLLIYEELAKAEKFPPFNSLHEGHSVLLEEFEEYWTEVKKFKDCNESTDFETNQEKIKVLNNIEKELIQVGAMVYKNLRFIEIKKTEIEMLKERIK